MSKPGRDVVLVWLQKGIRATDKDFEGGERWPDLDSAIVHAREAGRREGMDAWIRCDGKFVLSHDIVFAYAQSKLRR